MSQETSKWLNTLTLIGYVLKRGKAWHWRAASQGAESNHYDGAIPVEDVRRRLLFWEPVEGNVESVFTDGNGNTVRFYDNSRKTIIRPAGTFGTEDGGEVLYIPKTGFQIHGYDQWLVQNVETVLDQNANEIGIASAGLLKGGAIAWVQFQMPEAMHAQGFEIRPYATAATSLNGDLASTYLVGNEGVVCDNTMWNAIGVAVDKIKYKHTSGSAMKAMEVRERLGIRLEQVGEAFAQQVEEMCAIDVSDRAWSAFLEAHSPTEGKEGRGLTIATNKQAGLNSLWTSDPRVKPWAGTAFGVMQAVSTYDQHSGTVKGSSRVQRNMLKAVTGKFDGLANDTMATLQTVLAKQRTLVGV